jgi:ATP-dependent HslUV protease subunit HslV
MNLSDLHATTVVGIIHNGKAAIGSDGQATMDKTIMKSTVKKVRKLYNGKILAGFAGSTADAFTLFEKYEEKLNEYNGNMERAAVELAKEWRKDKFLQKLEALLIVMNNEKGLLISGQGDVIEPDDEIATIGSGGSYALSAARAMLKHAPKLSAAQIVEDALHIAADIDIYTNHNLTILEIED